MKPKSIANIKELRKKSQDRLRLPIMDNRVGKYEAIVAVCDALIKDFNYSGPREAQK